MYSLISDSHHLRVINFAMHYVYLRHDSVNAIPTFHLSTLLWLQPIKHCRRMKNIVSAINYGMQVIKNIWWGLSEKEQTNLATLRYSRCMTQYLQSCLSVQSPIGCFERCVRNKPMKAVTVLPDLESARR